MSNIKTAISIEKPLFDEIDALAEEMEVSRSSVFSMAAREFIQQRKNRKLLESINDACDDASDSIETNVTVKMKSKHRQLVIDQW
jgi:metal-responsive CopG/Arc/MetJ family transcriptional regulator